MEKMLSIAEARRALNRLPEELDGAAESSMVAITRRGRPVLAVLPWAQYEALMETLDVLGDQEQTAALREAIRALDKNEGIAWHNAGEPS